MSASPSGFASLRARFEQKDESTSPPSRGRSPAASLSVAGDASRPISRVRTTFIAVEPSRQMGDFNASEEVANKGGVINGDGADESSMNGGIEKPKTNGIDLTPQKSTKKEEDSPKQTTPKSSPKTMESPPQEKSETKNCIPSATKQDNPDSTAEDNTATILLSEPKSVATVSDGTAPEEGNPPLGSILKGSPFEQDDGGEASNARETGSTAESTQSLEEQGKDPSSPISNGKPKEAPAQKAGSQSKTKIVSRSSAIGRRSLAQPTSSSTETSDNKPQTSPLSHQNAATPSKQPAPKKMSPNSAASKEPKTEPLLDARKTTVERPSRAFVAPRASAVASKPAPKPGKKPGPTSPPSFTKPRPKSPTRPVRLPSSATAPTAASAAKLDVAPAATTKPRDRVPSNPTSLRQKPVRTSLPPRSNPTEKARDKPKSRLSTTSSKAPEGSFLNRMMRPTQSSSQKTHEKIEAKSPPKKTSGVRPKRKSDGSEKAKSENAAPSPPVQAPAGSSEALSMNGANNGIDEAAPASVAPGSSQ